MRKLFRLRQHKCHVEKQWGTMSFTQEKELTMKDFHQFATS